MIKVVLLTVLLSGCGLFGGKPPVEVTGDNAKVQQAEAGSTAQAEKIGEVVTINEDGIPTHWFIISALVFGMIIPQPKFMKIIF